jgi:cell wall-associated NlpC family hydrolase
VATEGGAQSDSKGAAQNVGPILALLALPLVLIIALFSGLGGGQGPNPNGAQAAQPISVAPGSVNQGALGDFTKYSNVALYLQKNSTYLDQIDTLINQKNTLLVSGQVYKTIPADRVDKMKTAFGEMLVKTQRIRTLIAQGDMSKAATETNALVAYWDKIERLAYGDGSLLIQSAVRTAEYNQDGKGSIKYARDHADQNQDTNGYPTVLDCSGFIDFSLYKAGIFKENERPSVQDLWASYANGATKKFTIIASALGGSISADRVRELIQPGDIILSSSGTIQNPFVQRDKASGSKGNENHAVIYIGTSPVLPGDLSAPPGDVVQSYDDGTRSGPQFTTLDERIGGSHGTVQAILRLTSGQ